MKTFLAMVVVLGVASVAAADDKKCVVEKVAIAQPARVKAPRCRRASAKLQHVIASAIRKAYHPERGGKPEVKFPCDGLGARVYEIVLEAGHGHGGSLALWRARLRGDGKYDVRGILYRDHSTGHRTAAVPHVQATGVVDLPELDKARAAITATVREVVPPRKPGAGITTSAAFSARDFHTVLRFVDEDGRVLERRYTGYATSAAQDTYLGLEIAQAALAPIWQLAPDTSAADHDDRNFFAASFNAAVPRFGDASSWWVMERYVDLARYLGTPAVIGGLLTRLTITKPGDRSQIDARADAVKALAKITGWDATAGGTSVEDAAKAYLATCR